MDLPQRKNNRLKEYDYSQNGAYFITLCTKDRKRILSEIVGEGSPLPQLSEYGIVAEQWIKKISEKYKDIDSYRISLIKYFFTTSYLQIIRDSFSKFYSRYYRAIARHPP